MKARVVVLFFAVALAVSAFAGDQKNNEQLLPNPGQISVEKGGGPLGNKQTPPMELQGWSRWAVWETKTGRIRINPEHMFCEIEARLTFGPGFFANLYTKENCGPGIFVRKMKWDVVLGADGNLAMTIPVRGTYYFPSDTDPNAVVVEEGDQYALMVEHTGCTANGTWPTYYGHFDGKFFHAVGEFESVCTGGNMWIGMGINPDIGPIHADFLITLEAVE